MRPSSSGSTRSRTRTRATVLLVLSILVIQLAAVPAVASAGASPSFDDSVVSEARGDVARLGLTVGPGENATVRIRGNGYHAQTVVQDGNRDGHVTLLVNTFETGRHSAARRAVDVADDGDRVVSATRTSTTADRPLPVGRYSVHLFTGGRERDESRLRIVPASFDRATTVPLATHRNQTLQTLRNATAAPVTDGHVVATGDAAVVRFDASGLAGVARLDDPPVRNLVFPTDSAPGIETTHTVRVRPTTRARNVTTLSVDYDAGDGGVPGGLSGVAVGALHVGVDTDDDGVVETDHSTNLESVSVIESGRLTLRFETPLTVDAGDVVVVRYDVTNPDTTGRDAVSARLGDVGVTGDAEYGLRGGGALGNGLDLRATAPDGDPMSVTAAQYVLDADRDALYAVFDTDTLEPGTYNASLALSPTNPLVSSESTPPTLDARFVVTDRRARFEAPSDAFHTAPGDLRVRATTTLAPGSEVTLGVVSRGDPTVISLYSTTVDADRRVTVTATIPDRMAGRPVELHLRESPSSEAARPANTTRYLGASVTGRVQNESS